MKRKEPITWPQGTEPETSQPPSVAMMHYCQWLLFSFWWRSTNGQRNLATSDSDGFGLQRSHLSWGNIFENCLTCLTPRIRGFRGGRLITARESVAPAHGNLFYYNAPLLLSPCPRLPSSVTSSTGGRCNLVVFNYKVRLQITLMASWLRIRALQAPFLPRRLTTQTKFKRWGMMTRLHRRKSGGGHLSGTRVQVNWRRFMRRNPRGKPWKPGVIISSLLTTLTVLLYSEWVEVFFFFFPPTLSKSTLSLKQGHVLFTVGFLHPKSQFKRAWKA